MAIPQYGKLFHLVEDTQSAYNVLLSECLCEDTFMKMDIKEAPFLLEPWLRTNNYVMISAMYGIGKTWFNLELAVAIAYGSTVGNWKCPAEQSRDVLYIDGEIGGAELQKRLRKLTKGRKNESGHKVHIISSLMIAEKKITAPNFTYGHWQKALFKLLSDNPCIKVVVFDNVSSLFSGIDENSKQEWDKPNQFLLSLKAQDITVMLIHHHGKEGSKGQRGTISRLDNVDIHITLTKPPGYSQERDGAKFIVTFDKARGLRGEATRQFVMQLIDSKDETSARLEAQAHMTKKAAIQAMLQDGKAPQNIAEELGTDIAYVSRIKKEAEG